MRRARSDSDHTILKVGQRHGQRDRPQLALLAPDPELPFTATPPRVEPAAARDAKRMRLARGAPRKQDRLAIGPHAHPHRCRLVRVQLAQTEPAVAAVAPAVERARFSHGERVRLTRRDGADALVAQGLDQPRLRHVQEEATVAESAAAAAAAAQSPAVHREQQRVLLSEGGLHDALVARHGRDQARRRRCDRVLVTAQQLLVVRVAERPTQTVAPAPHLPRLGEGDAMTDARADRAHDDAIQHDPRRHSHMLAVHRADPKVSDHPVDAATREDAMQPAVVAAPLDGEGVALARGNCGAAALPSTECLRYAESPHPLPACQSARRAQPVAARGRSVLRGVRHSLAERAAAAGCATELNKVEQREHDFEKRVRYHEQVDRSGGLEILIAG
eukprot:1638752-Prymnesium_polylepis.2